jgi:DNA repair protein RecO (recombination protein O)
MLHKTKGIVLHTLEYSETSIIVKLFTEDLGLQSYLVRSAKKKNSRTKAGIFQPLSLIEFVAYHNKRSKLQSLKEITHCYHFKGIPFDIKKSSIAFFIAEVLYKSIREEEQNKPLFEFIFASVQELDEKEGRVSDFHLFFLMELSKHLGFYPNDNYHSSRTIFNLYEGTFQGARPEHSYFLEKELSRNFHELIGNRDAAEFNPAERKELIHKMLEYYSIHLNGFKNVKSHLVLENIFI